MKNTQAPILFFIVALLTISQVLQAQNATSVTVHTGNFSGLKQQLTPGRYNNLYLAQSGITMVGSITVPAGLKVTLYPKDDFSGQPLELREDATTRYLKANGFADIGLQVSMIVETLPKGELPVKPPFITLYEHNFSGATKNLAEGRYQFYEFGHIDNDQVSAVKVPKNMKVTLYENEGYAGRSLTLTQDATADFLIKNKFNDATSSVWVEAIPVPEEKPVITKPGKEPITKDSVKTAPVAAPVDEIVTIYQGDFSGVSKTLLPGKYTLAMLGIGNDELSSISIKKGYRAVLFADDNFKGKSITLTEGVNTAKLSALEFNNQTSSLIIEAIPTVKVYQGELNTQGATLLPGSYDLDVLIDYGILDNEVSAVQVPRNYRVILYDLEKFKGRSLILTADASTEFLASKNFNNVTSSLTVEELPTAPTEEPRLMATLYEQDFNGRSQTVTPGKYEHTDLIMGNNAVSSVSVPYGLRVTLYEYGAQEGRMMRLTRNATTAFLQQNQFDNLTTSVVVEERPASELYVTIYADTYSGPSQQLKPGKYTADDILIGSKQLTSLRVPKGLMVMLYESRNFTGSSVTIERDKDFSDSKIFNDHFSSIVVEDISQPEVTPIPTITVVEKEKPTPVVADTVVQTVIEVANTLDCSLTEKEYYIALKAIESKAFSGEKMQTAKLATDGKCLTNEQIRGLAKSFSFEDQTLEFVLSTYPLAKEKSTFYSLEDLFSYMSSKDRFNKFLLENK